MGWFWADAPKPVTSIAPHPIPTPGAKPPPECPAHKSETLPKAISPQTTSSSQKPSACPVKSTDHPLRNLATPSSSPKVLSSTSPSSSEPHPPSSSSTLSKLNPLNYIPANLSNTRPTNSPQEYSLPLERETSSIPRGDSEANWEYPSPQQMYNAMLRKGYTDTPTDAVTSMVAVHNFLNEGAWDEIVEWERIFGQGLAKGWDQCRRGEQGIAMDRARQEFMKARREALGLPPLVESSSGGSAEDIKPRLLRFMGRPGEPTPKARMLSLLGSVFPEKFGNEPPFDRHDWYVSRRHPDGSTKEVRYVIDYYSGGVQETGEPVFYLDIRPALDSPTAAAERMMRWGGDVWWRASGGLAREKERVKEEMTKRTAS